MSLTDLDPDLTIIDPQGGKHPSSFISIQQARNMTLIPQRGNDQKVQISI